MGDVEEPRRKRGLSPLTLCHLYFCVMGLVVLAIDLSFWARTGHYESPTRWGLYALKWLSLPGIALAGGSGMVAGSNRPARWLSFAGSLAMLLLYAFIWGISDHVLTLPDPLEEAIR